MSEPPDQVLGREDYGWGMSVFYRATGKEPTTIIDDYGLDEGDGMSIAVFALRFFGYSERASARILNISRDQANRRLAKINERLKYRQ